MQPEKQAWQRVPVVGEPTNLEAQAVQDVRELAGEVQLEQAMLQGSQFEVVVDR